MRNRKFLKEGYVDTHSMVDALITEFIRRITKNKRLQFYYNEDVRREHPKEVKTAVLEKTLEVHYRISEDKKLCAYDYSRRF